MSLRATALALLLFVSPLSASAAAPDVDSWLIQHPNVASAIVWEFPDVIPDPPNRAGVNTGRSPWRIVSSRTPGAVKTAEPAPAFPEGWSCPIPFDSPEPGKILTWCQWPESYRQRMKGYFQTYWNWMETSWPLYQQYRDGGFAVKPAGFDERFASSVDPETSAEAALLPFSAQVMKDMYTHVLYEPAAAVDLYLKTTALQLVLEIGSFVDWKLGDYDAGDLSVVLDGRQLFRYFPSGSSPWGGQQTVDKEGYDAAVVLPAPPLLLMKFLMREGILRTTRFETVARLLEWERNLQHTMGTPQTLTGACGKEYGEVYWGTKSVQPLDRILNGTVMACPLVPQPGATTSGYYNTALTRYTGGCGTTGGINHRVMRQINVPAEMVAFGHGQIRFVVEKAPFEQMLNELEPLLPAEPAIDDGLLHPSSSSMESQSVLKKFSAGIPIAQDRSATVTVTKLSSSKLANAYLDHNDDPYGMKALTDIPVKEALIPEAVYHRWFAQPPDWLTDEQEAVYRAAHGKRVSLRPTQLRIARLPLYLFQYYCWKQDAGKPHEQTETYKQFFQDYTPPELEATGFWTRFDQKLEELGGCEELPPMW